MIILLFLVLPTFDGVYFPALQWLFSKQLLKDSIEPLYTPKNNNDQFEAMDMRKMPASATREKHFTLRQFLSSKVHFL